MTVARNAQIRNADVVVLGNGPAGSAAALTLARLGASVIVVDRSSRRPTLGEGLPPNASPVLRNLGLWDRFLQQEHQPAHGNRSTWSGSTPQEYDFIRNPYGVGWHLDRARFDAMLTDAFAESGGIVWNQMRVVGCDRERNQVWSLALASGGSRREVQTDYVIDASGRARRMARTLGGQRRAYDRLVGIVGVLTPAASTSNDDSFTLVEAVPDGWWYATSLPDTRLVIGYMTDADIAAQRSARNAGSWMALLAQTTLIKERVERHGYVLDRAPHLVCADSSCLDPVAGDGWCAAGDAAAACDPLSSNGITSALAGGVWAAHAVVDARSGGLGHYQDRMKHAFARYRAHWLTYYALEQRWPAAPFWQRRHAALRALF